VIRSRRRLVSLLILALCGGVALVFWLWHVRGRENNGPQPVTARAWRRTFSSTVLATGAVKPQVGAEVRVGARLSGKVERLLANIGDMVKKGQIIAELEKKDLEAVVAQRRAELRTAEAKLSAVKTIRPKEIEKAEADLAQREATAVLTRSEFDREDALWKKGLASAELWDQAKERLSVAEAQLASARKSVELTRTQFTEDMKQATAEVDRAKAAVLNAEVELSYATITAPISGVIGSVSTQEGETVAAGLNAPTFVTIVDLGRLQVDTFVDEVDIGKIAVGQKAVFAVDAFPSREFAGKVKAIYPRAVIQENVVNYDVVVEITNPYEGLLRPEMTASVSIVQDRRENVLAIPAKAIKRSQGKNVVYVVSKDRVEPCEIKVGWKDNQWVEVVSGVEEGQEVLLEEQTSTPGQP